MLIKPGKLWSNQLGNQKLQVSGVCDARSLQDVQAAIAYAKQHNVAVKAVGAGHAWSDVALTEGIVIETRKLNALLDIDCAKATANVGTLFRAQAGILLKKVNQILEKRGQMLENMGGWDAQTLAGVISTSTHGSGITYGPMSDQVVSLDIINTDGSLVRIEPHNGPTDPEQYAATYPNNELIQDDSYFDALRVGLGSAGIIYSVTIAVRPFRYLREERTLVAWSVVQQGIADTSLLTKNDHVEVYLNPYHLKPESLCLVTARNYTSQKPPLFSHRNLFAELFGYLHPLTSRLMCGVMNTWPKLAPKIIATALKSLVRKKYVDKPYKVHNLGSANRMPGYSLSIGVALQPASAALAAVQAVHDVTLENAQRNIVTVSPICLRFVKASTAYLSMAEGRDTMMIELANLKGIKNGHRLLEAYEKRLYAAGGRPHWGKYNVITHEQVKALYPKFPEWQTIVTTFNQGDDLLRSPFSTRVGI